MVLSQWCPGGVMVFRWCSVVTLLVRSCLGRVPVVSQWCPGHVPWCPGSVAVCPVVSQCCPGGWCPSRVLVVSQWRLVMFQWCPVVSRWLVSQWCLEGVPVLFQCPGRVPCFLGPVVFHPVVSRSCPVFHAVVSRSRPAFRKICDCGAVGVLLVRWLVGLRWGGAGR